MTRQRALCLGMIAGTIVAACDAGLSAERPNVIFFLSDDQRADFMGCAGHEILETPTMDRLASRGVRFRNMALNVDIPATILQHLGGAFRAHPPRSRRPRQRQPARKPPPASNNGR